MAAKRKPRMPQRPSLRGKEDQALHAALSQLSRERLLEIIQDGLKRNVDFRSELLSGLMIEVEAESADELVQWASDAIQRETESEEDFGGDYQKIKRYFQQLVVKRAFDGLREVARELFRLGSRQVEMSDEGLMAEDIDDCFEVVFRSLADSPLTPAEQMFWEWELGGHDSYCVCRKAHQKFWKRKFSPHDWSGLADALIAKLSASRPAPPPSKTKKRQPLWQPHNYSREADLKMLQQAFRSAGRKNELDIVRELNSPNVEGAPV